MTATLSPAVRGRLDWVDVAKGTAILLVAVHHAALYALSVDLAPGQWRTATNLLQSFRMPLFFLVSGLLASSSLSRSWRSLVAGKLLLWLWAYYVWSALTLVAYAITEDTRGHIGNGLGRELLLLTVWPQTGLWYLLALALFLPLVRLAHGRVPPAAVVAGAALLAVVAAAGWLHIGNTAYDRMTLFFLFFVLGCHGRALVVSLATRLSLPATALLVVAYVAAACVLTLGRHLDVPLVQPLLALLAVTAGVAAAVRVSPWPVGRLLQAVGARTLQIYVAHELLLGLMAVGLQELGAGPVPLPVGALVPLVMAAVAVLVALALHRLLGGVPGLYAPPAALVRRVADGPRAARRSPAAAVD